MFFLAVQVILQVPKTDGSGNRHLNLALSETSVVAELKQNSKVCPRTSLVILYSIPNFREMLTERCRHQRFCERRSSPRCLFCHLPPATGFLILHAFYKPSNTVLRRSTNPNQAVPTETHPHFSFTQYFN